MQRSRKSFCSALVCSVLIFSGCAPENGTAVQSDSPGEPALHTEPTPAFLGLSVHAQRAREAEAQEDWSSAREEYQQSLNQEPGHPIALLRIARYEARLGQAEAAIQHLNGAADAGASADLSQDAFFDSLREREDFQAASARLSQNGPTHAPAELVHTFADSELWPEGIATDAATGNIYVGSFKRKKVVRILTNGAVEDFGTTATDKLQSVIGIWVDSERQELWAATGDQPTPGEPMIPGEVVRYDIETGKLLARYPGPDDGQPQLINDVTVGPDGTAYITESLGGRIFVVVPGRDALELLRSFPLLGFINGIAISGDGSTLYFAHVEGLSSIDLANGEVARVTALDGSFLGMGDGLSWAGDGLVIVQNQEKLNFRITHIRLDEHGHSAVEVSILPSGVPAGLIPFTSAVLDREVFVVATSDFALLDRGEVPPASAVVRMSL